MNLEAKLTEALEGIDPQEFIMGLVREAASYVDFPGKIITFQLAHDVSDADITVCTQDDPKYTTILGSMNSKTAFCTAHLDGDKLVFAWREKHSGNSVSVDLKEPDSLKKAGRHLARIYNRAYPVVDHP